MRKTKVTDFFFHRIPLAVSVIFHPLVIPTIGTVMLLYAVVPLSLMSDKGKQLILFLVFTCTFILPLAFLPVLYLRKLHHFVHHNERQERIIPLIFTSLMYYLTFVMLRRMGAPFLIQGFIFASAISVVLTLVISLFWKISMHTIGIGGLTALIVVILVYYRIDLVLYLIIAILLSGIIASSRLGLEAHTPLQVYVGYLLGFVVTYGSFFLL
jgi:membrane-associated phospholipid phosphatase